MDKQFGIEHEVKALRAELGTLRREFYSVRDELHTQSKNLRTCSIDDAASPIVEDAMSRATMSWESRFRDLEENINSRFSAESEARSAKIQSACASLETTLREAISSAVAMEREAHEQTLAETHAAMVTHGTYVVSRLEEFASIVSPRQADEGASLGAVLALRHALQAGRSQAPAGAAILSRIEEECTCPIDDFQSLPENPNIGHLGSSSEAAVQEHADEADDEVAAGASTTALCQCKVARLAGDLKAPAYHRDASSKRPARATRIKWASCALTAPATLG